MRRHASHCRGSSIDVAPLARKGRTALRLLAGGVAAQDALASLFDAILDESSEEALADIAVRRWLR